MQSAVLCSGSRLSQKNVCFALLPRWTIAFGMASALAGCPAPFERRIDAEGSEFGGEGGEATLGRAGKTNASSGAGERAGRSSGNAGHTSVSNAKGGGDTG